MRNILKVITLAMICVFGSAGFVAAQDLTKKQEEDSAACMTHFSSYREALKQRNYQEAYPGWKAVVTNCPMLTKSIFADGLIILETLLKEEKKEAKREQYLTELFDLFDLQIKCYPADEASILGRIGVYTIKYRPKEYKKAYQYLDKSINLSGEEASPQMLDTYFHVAEVYIINDTLSIDTVMDIYYKMSEVMDLMLDKAELQLEAIMHEIYKLNDDFEEETINQQDYNAAYEAKREDSVQVRNYLIQLKNVANNLDLRFSKHVNCEMLQQIYEKKIDTKDERTLKQIIKFFNKENCTDNDLFYIAVDKLYKIKPTANTALYMGILYSTKGKQYSEALNYFKEAADWYKKESDIINAYIMMADCYIKIGQYASVREIANQILQLNPNKGIAYILIGDAYTASIASCNTGIPGAVYWAAADKYAKAKAIDASIAEIAQKKLNETIKRFPKMNVFFNLGYGNGQSYKIECWINETTIVREK